MIDFDATLGLIAPTTLHLEKLGEIPGWLTDEAIDFTSRLAHLQRALNQAKGVLELGIFRGKYLALLSDLYGADVPIVGVDAFLARIGEPLEPRWRIDAENAIRGNIDLISGRGQSIIIIGDLTRDVDLAALASHCPGGYSFISVDAGHEAEDVVVDLGIATSVATQDAIIALDDVFNPRVPGVAEGVCRFFESHPTCPFRPFAICGNKVFLSGKKMYETYFDYSRWLVSNVTDPAYIRKSGQVMEEDRNANFAPRFLGSETTIFVWN